MNHSQNANPAMAPRQGAASLRGLVSAQSLGSIQAAERSAADAARQAANEQNTTPVMIALADHINHAWSSAKEAKREVEQEMLSAVRARRGEYDPDKLARIREQGGSEIYMMLFATKARQFKSLLTDVLIGDGKEQPWSLTPTPKPDLPPNVVRQIFEEMAAQAQQMTMQGTPMSPQDVRQRLLDMKREAEQRVLEIARAEAEEAERTVADVLAEGNFIEAFDQFLDDLCVFKTACLKGPILRKSNELQWSQDQTGRPVAVVKEVTKRFYERVDPFMLYPARNSKSVHDGSLIERHRLRRGDLYAMIGIPGYSEDAIRAVLDEHGTGGLTHWLAIDNEKETAEGRANTLSGVDDTIDALQFWGSASGKMLREWGMSEAEVPDEAREYEIEAWLVGSWVIKAVINPDPLQRRPYYTDGFSKIPGAFWHNSLYDVIRDCCDMCNAVARALAGNLGIASGPQVWINTDRMDPNEKITELFPWKLWQFTSDPMGGTAPPMGFFQPSSHAQELMAVFERFSQMADEYAGIPRYMVGMGGGEGGAGRTASGMSMMLGNANKQVKGTVSGVDLNVTGPLIERTYQHILMYSPEMGLAGDLQVKARGAISLVAREAAQVRLNEFLAATGNPIDMQIVGLEGRAELLRQAVKRLDLNTDKVVPSASTVRMRAMQAQMAQLQAQQQPVAGNGQELQNGAPVTDNFQPQGA